MTLLTWFFYTYKNITSIPIPVFMFLDILLTNRFFNSFDFFFFFNKLNTNLMNGLLLIHPILLYSIFSFFILILITSSKKKYYSIFTYSACILLNKSIVLYLLLVLLISIFLGSWWAQTELNWGGWWGWDLIEIISLNYLTMGLLLLHLTRYINNSIFVMDISLKLLIYTLIIKFNFLDSVHNFSSSGSYIQNFYELLFSLIILLLLTSRLKKFNTNFFTISSLENIVFIGFFILNLFFYLFIFYEFFLIFWQDISTLMLFIKYKYLYSTLFIVFIFCCFNSVTYHLLFGSSFLPYWESLYLQSILISRNFAKSLTLHLAVFLSIYILFFNYIFYDLLTSYPLAQIPVVNVSNFSSLFLQSQYLTTTTSKVLLIINKVIMIKDVYVSNMGGIIEFNWASHNWSFILNLGTYFVLFIWLILIVLTLNLLPSAFFLLF